MDAKSSILIGRKYGDGGIVLDFSHYGGKNGKLSYWKVRCKCGYEQISSYSAIRLTKIGCKKCWKTKSSNDRTIDLVGKTFGRWTVLSKAVEKRHWHFIYWHCRCQCGTMRVVNGIDLRQGKSTSCGCYHSEISRKIMKTVAATQKLQKKYPRYNPNLTNEDRIKRRNVEGYYSFIQSIYERDNYTCKCCNKHGGNLNAHHLYNWSKYKELRLVKENLITLCTQCHKNFHKNYGHKDNTKYQFQEWLIKQTMEYII